MGKASLWKLKADLLALAVTIALAGMGVARADESEAQAAPAPSPAAGADDGSVSVSVAGATVAIDPKTGKLRPPTPAQIRQLARVMAQYRLAQRTGPASRSAPGPQQAVEHPNGMLSLVVGTDHLDFLVVNQDASGKLVTTCVDDANTAAARTKDPATESEKE